MSNEPRRRSLEMESHARPYIHHARSESRKFGRDASSLVSPLLPPRHRQEAELRRARGRKITADIVAEFLEQHLEEIGMAAEARLLEWEQALNSAREEE